MGREVPVHKRNVPLVRDCHFRPVIGGRKCYTSYGVINVARFAPVMSDNFSSTKLYPITGGEKMKIMYWSITNRCRLDRFMLPFGNALCEEIG